MLKDKDFLASLHPLIRDAILGPKRKPKPTRVQRQGYDRRTSAFRGHKPRPTATTPMDTLSPLSIAVTDASSLDTIWKRATTTVTIAGERNRITAIGNSAEAAATALLRKLRTRRLRFGTVTVTIIGGSTTTYPNFADLANIGIPTPGAAAYRSHILRRRSPHANMVAPPGTTRPVDGYGRLGPIERACSQCGEKFEVKSPWHRYCCDLCSKRAWRQSVSLFNSKGV